MGWFTALFSAPEAISKGVDMLGGAVDKAIFTDEEKGDLVKSLYDQFTPRALTRRILAVIIYFNFFLHVNTLIVLWYFGKNVDILWKVVEMEGGLVVTVTIFYFGYYGIKQIFDRGKK